LAPTKNLLPGAGLAKAVEPASVAVPVSIAEAESLAYGVSLFGKSLLASVDVAVSEVMAESGVVGLESLRARRSAGASVDESAAASLTTAPPAPPVTSVVPPLPPVTVAVPAAPPVAAVPPATVPAAKVVPPVAGAPPVMAVVPPNPPVVPGVAPAPATPPPFFPPSAGGLGLLEHPDACSATIAAQATHSRETEQARASLFFSIAGRRHW
jgi:hypothetical protein